MKPELRMTKEEKEILLRRLVAASEKLTQGTERLSEDLQHVETGLGKGSDVSNIAESESRPPVSEPPPDER